MKGQAMSEKMKPVKTMQEVYSRLLSIKGLFSRGDSRHHLFIAIDDLMKDMDTRPEPRQGAKYDKFLRKYYNDQCEGCPEGHASFWKTIIESPEWKEWIKIAEYDIPECEELGIISKEHWEDFLKFILSNFSLPTEVNFGGILAQGYCTERNSKKVLDSDLIEDMVKALDEARKG